MCTLNTSGIALQIGLGSGDVQMINDYSKHIHLVRKCIVSIYIITLNLPGKLAYNDDNTVSLDFT